MLREISERICWEYLCTFLAIATSFNNLLRFFASDFEFKRDDGNDIPILVFQYVTRYPIGPKPLE